MKRKIYLLLTLAVFILGISFAADAQNAQPGYYIFTERAISQSGVLDAFVAHKESKGFHVQVVDVWDNLFGKDAAEAIRDHLKERYVAENIQYVLFIGDSRSETSHMPMMPMTPVSIEEDPGRFYETPSDYFYADLTGNWDLDADGDYGEYDGDFGSGGVDLHTEVAVGRIPFTSTVEIREYLDHVIRYENGDFSGDWTRKVLLSLNWFDTPTTNWHFGKAVDDVIKKAPGFSTIRLYDPVHDVRPPSSMPATRVPCNYDNVKWAWEQHVGYHIWTATADSFVPNEEDEWGEVEEESTSNHFTYRNEDYLDPEYPAVVFAVQPGAGDPKDSFGFEALGIELLRKRDAIATISPVNWYTYNSGYPEMRTPTTFTYKDSFALGIAYRYSQRMIRDFLPMGDALYEAKATYLRHEGAYSLVNVYAFNLYGDPSLRYSNPEKNFIGDPVVWQGAEGMEVANNTLKKNVEDSWENAGAYSTHAIEGDGGVRFTAEETETHRILGLSNILPQDQWIHYSSIQYGIHLTNKGRVNVYENGDKVGEFGAYVKGDYFSVVRKGTQVYYKKNNSIFYASTVPSEGPLWGDMALFSEDAYMNDVRILGANSIPNRGPQTRSQYLMMGNNEAIKFRLKAFDWDRDPLSYHIVRQPSGGNLDMDEIPTLTYASQHSTIDYSTTDSLSYKANDGKFESPETIVRFDVFEDLQPITWASIHGAVIDDNTIIKTEPEEEWGTAGAISLQELTSPDASASVQVQETDTFRMFGLSPVSLDDSFLSIKHGILFRPGGSSVIYENGTRVPDFAGVQYKTGDIFSIERRSGGIIYYKRNGAVIYTSGLTSEEPLIVDCALYSKDATLANVKLSGAEVLPDTPLIGVENFYVSTRPNTQVTVQMNKASQAGDCQMRSVPAHGDYQLNGCQVVYTPHADFMGLDSFRYRLCSGPLCSEESQVSIIVGGDPIILAEQEGVVEDGNTVIKEGDLSDVWGNSGAISSQVIEESGAVVFRALETGKHRMIGLSAQNADSGFNLIDHAIFLKGDGKIVVFEKGIRYPSSGDFGEYEAGNSLSIEKDIDGNIIYKREGAEFYRSLDPTEGPLLVDLALYSKGATLADVFLFTGLFDQETFFRRGLVNPDSSLDISDAIGVLSYLFADGSTPTCLKAADVNDDGRVDISDAIALLHFLFSGEVDSLPKPFNECGRDLTPDTLTCESCPACEE